MCEKDKQNSERSDRPDEIGSDPVMETLRLFLLRQIVTNLLKMYEEYRKNSERSDRPDEIGSDPNMDMFSRHTGCRAAVVPRQDRSLSLEFFISVPFPFVPCLPPTPTTVPDDFHEMPLSVFVRQDFGRKLTSAVAMSIRVIWCILYGTRRLRNLIVLDHQSYFLSGFLSRIHHTKPCFPSHMKPCFPPHIHHLSHFYRTIVFSSDGASNQGDEIDHIKKSEDDEIQSLIDELYSKDWSPGYEHYQHLEENNISPTCKTKSSDGEAENLNQLLGSITSNQEFSLYDIELLIFDEDNNSSSTLKDCGILSENMISSNDVRCVFPLATELPCDPALKQGMATLSAVVPHVTTSPSLLAPTQPTLMAEERGAQSLQCSTKSTAQDNLKLSSGYEHYQHLEENNISPTCKTKSGDGEAENLNQPLGSITSNQEFSQCDTEFLHNCFLDEDNSTELPCSDPALKQGMATLSPVVPHVTTSPSLLAPTQPTLMAEERGAQSLQCSTKSTAQDNLEGCLLEEERSVAIINPSMDEKLELTTRCIQTTQPATSSLHLEAFSNGEDNMQLVSSKSQPLDASNTGGKVVNADEICTAISHREKKITIGTKKTKCGTAKDRISLADLQQRCHLKREDAARSFGVSVTTLKRVRGHHGISEWKPHSIFNPKPATESVQGAVGAFISPTTSSHSDSVDVGSNYQNSQGSKPPRPQREKLSGSYNKPSIGGQDEIASQMLENNLSAHKGQLQEQNRFHLQRQEAGNVTVKATYGEHTVRVPTSATSGVVELKKELAKRLELEHGSFDVKYQDEDLDCILLIACDEALRECLTSSTSRGNQFVSLLVLDKVVNSKNSDKVEEH